MENVLFDMEDLEGLLQQLKPIKLNLDEKTEAELEASQRRYEEYIKKNNASGKGEAT